MKPEISLAGAFLSAPYGTSALVLGLPATEGWAVIGGIVLAAVLVAGWVLMRMRRGRSGEDTFDSSGRPVR